MRPDEPGGHDQARASAAQQAQPREARTSTLVEPSIPQMQTSSLFAMVRALEQAGVLFIDADDSGGEGVRLRRR